MFDIDKFYHAAQNCEQVDKDGLIKYIKSFKNIVLWGAGYLGEEIGVKFKELNISVTEYWDLRADEIKTLNGYSVRKSFEKKYNPDESIFIFCITNSFVRDQIRQQLYNEGYNNVLIGEFVFQGIICTANSYEDFHKCRASKACDAYTCNKNEHFLPKHIFPNKSKPEKSVFFRNVTIVINQKCTLQCKYCYAYTNGYKSEQRINFPTERILKDIDLFFDAVDGVKFVPLIGGETFLHPDLSQIIKKILEKDNFGLLNVTTNGIVKMKEEQFEGMQSNRVQLVFSNYKDMLTPKQNEVYDKNIEFAKTMGVEVIESNATPTWSVPTELYDRHYSIEIMKKKRKACLSPFNCKYLKNGKFYPCFVADSIHNLEIANYSGDYILLDEARNSNELHNQIYDLIDKDYFLSCGHCDGECGFTGLTAKAGEQGYHEFIKDGK